VTWSLVTYTAEGTEAPGNAAPGQSALGVLHDDGTLVAPPDLKRWPTLLDLLAEQPDLSTLDIDGPVTAYDSLLAPLRYPRKVICAGVNYGRHIAEMGGEIPAGGWHPYFFLKAPTTSVIGPHDPVLISRPDQNRFDWEAELAVIIGLPGKDIPAERALAHVAGYCVANDITARGRHRRQSVPADAFTYDWFAAKSMDGSLPMGPGITPSFLIKDVQDLQVRLWVNGELQQDGSISDMICPVAELVSAASEVVTLEPGDVIATGTPSGVGVARGLYLRGGDVVRVSISGLGSLENTVKEMP
jgi:2-keto-4-pentenoate hydratase/2-oxohepta-3-ene-1,7-dioic acid hydratase in catechol pathway